MFGLGGVLYVSVLLINAVAILSEDRFLARINLSPGTHEPGFGASADSQSVQAKIVNLIASVRTLMRSKCARICASLHPHGRARCLSILKKHANSRIVPLIVVNTLIILYQLVLG